MKQLPAFVKKVCYSDSKYTTVYVNFTEIYRVGDIKAELNNPRIEFNSAPAIAVSMLEQGFDPTKPLLLYSIDISDRDRLSLDIEDELFPLYPLVDGHTRLMALFIACYIKSLREGTTLKSISINHSNWDALDSDTLYRLAGESLLYIIDSDENYEKFRINATQYEDCFNVTANIKIKSSISGSDIIYEMFASNTQSPFTEGEIRDGVYRILHTEGKGTKGKINISHIARMLQCSVVKAQSYVCMALGLHGISLPEGELMLLHRYLCNTYQQKDYYKDPDAIATRNDLTELFLDNNPKKSVIIKAIFNGTEYVYTQDFPEFSKWFKYIPMELLKNGDEPAKQVIVIREPPPQEVDDITLLQSESEVSLIKDAKENHTSIFFNASTVEEKAIKWVEKERANTNSSHFVEVLERKLYQLADEFKKLESVLGIPLIAYDNDSLKEKTLRLKYTGKILYGRDLLEIAKGTSKYCTMLDIGMCLEICRIWNLLNVLGSLHPKLESNTLLLQNPVVMVEHLIEMRRKF